MAVRLHSVNTNNKNTPNMIARWETRNSWTLLKRTLEKMSVTSWAGLN